MARVANHLWPGLTRPARSRIDRLSHDPAAAEQVRQDPLRHGLASVRWYMECLAAERRALAACADLDLPLLYLVTETFFEAVASLDKTLHAFPGAFHDLFQELDKDIVRDRVWRWCETCLPR